MGSGDVFALSIHADYHCRQSGECCSADWDVPVELPVYRSLFEAVEHGRLRPVHRTPSNPFIVEPDLPDEAAAMLERTEGGECIFLDRVRPLESNRRKGSNPHPTICVVHRDLGEAALPSTCRHFPRLAVRDRRGTFITLSHFCPTAASMLFREDRPLAIVAAPAAFPDGDYGGFVVTDEDLPPLLQPHMLMDLEGYSAWERHMVARCASPDRLPESVVVTLQRDATELRQWRPGDRTLAETIAALPREFVDAPIPSALDSSLELFVEVREAMPDDLRPEIDEDGLVQVFVELVRPRWSAFRRPVNRYLAAKAFASWTAYQGRGVIAIVRGLQTALALVRVEAARACRGAGRGLDQALLVEAVRRADFSLNHLAVGEDLAEAWSKGEG